MPDKKNELVARQDEDLPDFLREETNVEGTEDIAREDVLMPRLAIAQGLSPQINKTKPEFIKGLELGQMFNTLTHEIYGEGPLRFWIVRRDKPRFIEFKPMEEGGGIVDYNVPANDPRTKFGRDGELPVATKFYDYIIVLESGEMLAMSCKGTSLKAAQYLNSLIKARNQAVYAGNYTVRIAGASNDKGDYFVFLFENEEKPNNWCTEEEYAVRAKMFAATKDKVIEIEREPGEDDIVDGEVVEPTEM